MTELATGALLGFALAASPGPVNALAFMLGLKHGTSRAVFLIAGAHSADLLYAILVVVGAGPLFSRPAAQAVLSLGGGVFLAFIAVKNMYAVRSDQGAVSGRGQHGASLFQAYRDGFTVALLSPLTIVFWMSVFGGYYADIRARGSGISAASILAAVFVGTVLWMALVAGSIRLGRTRLSGRSYRLLVTILSIALLGFAGRLLWRGLGTMLLAAGLSLGTSGGVLPV